MNIKNAIVIITLLLPILCLSQTKRDVLYLKNQSIIKGNIIEQSEQIVKIETLCGNILAYLPDEISKMEKENVPYNSVQKNIAYFNNTTMGLMLGSSYDVKPAQYSFLMEHNIQINKHISTGAVLGIELINEAVAPVGINTKLHLAHSKNSHLFISTFGGYSVSLEKPELEYWEVLHANGGYFGNVEIGVVVKSESNIGFIIAAGYRYNTLNYKRRDWQFNEIDRKMYFNRLSVRIGVTIF